MEALTFPPTSGKSFIMGADEAMESELGLGELAGLTVANEADSLAYDVSKSTRFILRGGCHGNSVFDTRLANVCWSKFRPLVY